jgi:hypothetical protein
MNKNLKRILIILNLGVLTIAVLWFIKYKEYEPLTVIIAQVVTLLGLLFESHVSEIITKDVSKSKIKIDTEPGSKIHTMNVNDSDIDVKNR